MAKLTDLQQAWLDAYLTHFNATKAAKEAGYKASSYSAYGVIGHENRHHPDIADEIKRRLNESAMSADEVLNRLAEQARANYGEIMRVVENEEGRRVLSFDWDRVKEMGHLVKSISFTQSGMPRVEFYDKQGALEKIGKAHGLFVDRHEVTGKDGERLVVTLDWGDDASGS